jgi:hypothetical protein
MNRLTLRTYILKICKWIPSYGGARIARNAEAIEILCSNLSGTNSKIAQYKNKSTRMNKSPLGVSID